MTSSTFPYPGGKANYANWIVDHIPEHSCFVEVFGGAASIIANKERSYQEVYNDINNDLVVFFRTLREQPNELKTYLEKFPYSRAEYERIAGMWFDEQYRPDDDIKRSAWFFFLRHANFSGKLSRAGFSTSRRNDDNRARRYKRSVDELVDFAGRFQDVTIEDLDYANVIEQYDTAETVFYFDPPYVDVGDEYYNHDGKFDHAQFVDELSTIEGKWIVSYNELPSGLSNYNTVERETRYTMSSERHTQNTERLVLNFDPTETIAMSSKNQTALDAFDSPNA